MGDPAMGAVALHIGSDKRSNNTVRRGSPPPVISRERRGGVGGGGNSVQFKSPPPRLASLAGPASPRPRRILCGTLMHAKYHCGLIRPAIAAASSQSLESLRII